MNKRLYIIIIVTFCFFVGLVLWFFTTREPNNGEHVEVLFLPKDAVVEINNQNVKYGQVIQLNPGEYEVAAERDGFLDFDDVFQIFKDKSNYIDFTMSPSTEEGLNYVKENENLYLDFEDRSGERAIEQGITFSEINPITRDLPERTFFYSIGYRINPDDDSNQSIIIEVDASPGYKNAAIQHIENLGYNPAELHIVFRNHRNPFYDN